MGGTVSAVDRQPFRFAIQATNASGAENWREFCCQVEELGYSSLLLADHYLGPGPAQQAAHTPRQDLAPIAAIATAAAHTTTLRVGCRVFCIDYHVPAVLAKEVATLDLLSDGRLELGIGAGWSDVEYEAMGLTFDTPGRRIAKLKEVVALIKAHCGVDEIACVGDYVNVNGYRGTPPPVQRPHPPIMIGGGGKRVLTYAGREADIVSINTVPFAPRNDDGLTPQEEAARRFEYVRAAAGTRMGDFDIEASPYFVLITDDVEAAYESVATKTGTALDVLRGHPNVLVGAVDTIAETLQQRREIYGVNYVTIQQTQAERFAPIVARLTGT
jgi:probable F420-dependent oxidoreductase